MAWVLLVIAGLLEVGWAIGLKYTQGFTRPWPSVLTITAMVLEHRPGVDRFRLTCKCELQRGK